jgi:hypothetical protein
MPELAVAEGLVVVPTRPPSPPAPPPPSAARSPNNKPHDADPSEREINNQSEERTMLSSVAPCAIAEIPFAPPGGDPKDPEACKRRTSRAWPAPCEPAGTSMNRTSLSFGVLTLGAALSACGDAGDAATAGTGGAASTTGAAPSSSASTAAGNGGAGGDGTGGDGSLSGPVGPGAPACDLAPPPGEVPCEAVGDGRCFYIDAANGDDAAGDGSHATPWRTLANVVSYYGTPGENGSTAAPPSAIDLAPGDVVYLRAGTYDQLYNYHGELLVARFRQVSGAPGEPISLVAYPGEQPVVDPGGAGVGIDVMQASHFRIRGLEVMNGYGAGVRVSDAEDVVLTHLRPRHGRRGQRQHRRRVPRRCGRRGGRLQHNPRQLRSRKRRYRRRSDGE